MAFATVASGEVDNQSQVILVPLEWDYLGIAWGRGFSWERIFGNGFILGREEENKKTDFLRCIQGSWSQDRQVLRPGPTLIHFREVHWWKRLKVQVQFQVYLHIWVQLSLWAYRHWTL